MSLRNEGEFSYGDNQLDIREALKDYSANSYPAKYFADALCKCGSKEFKLLIDDNEGVAVRICKNCQIEHPIGDSAEYLSEAEFDECECICGSSFFEITVGVALYDASEAVKWLYIGCRCLNCNLTAGYADWKNQFNDYKKLLSLT